MNRKRTLQNLVVMLLATLVIASFGTETGRADGDSIWGQSVLQAADHQRGVLLASNGDFGDALGKAIFKALQGRPHVKPLWAKVIWSRKIRGQCPEGYRPASGECAKCPKGYTLLNDGKGFCYHCPPGYAYVPFQGGWCYELPQKK